MGFLMMMMMMMMMMKSTDRYDIVRDTGDGVPDDDDGVAMMVVMKSTDSYAQLQPLHQQRLSEEKHRQYR